MVRYFVIAWLIILNHGVFSQGEFLNINTDKFEYAPSFSADGKWMVFQSNRGGAFGLYECQIGDRGRWSEPKLITGLFDNAGPAPLTGGPALSYDGSRLYFCAHAPGGLGDMDIYYAERKGSGWGKAMNAGAPLNSEGYEGFPSISADGKRIYFTRSGSEAKCFKIYYSEKDNEGKWQEPVMLPPVINSMCVKTPKILSDGRTLIFAAEKTAGSGEYDLYKTVLNANGEWKEAAAIDFSNTPQSEQGGVITEENELIYYSRRGDLFSQPVPPEYILNKVDLVIVDAENKKPVKSAIKVVDAETSKEIKTDSTSSAGRLAVVLLPGKLYDFVITADKYEETKHQYGITASEDFKRTSRTVPVVPKKKQVVLKISDSETNKGLSVKIKITNLDTKEEIIIEEKVGRDGKYAINLREGNKYNVEVSSQEGYAYSRMKIDVPETKTGERETPSEPKEGDAGVIREPEELVLEHEIKVAPLKEGTRLIMKDIFFDFNSHELQDSSYAELYHVVELLNENPKVTIEINAHTDDVGSDDFNNRLSQKRAQSIVDYLVSQGIDKKRLTAKGYGKTMPVASNATEEGRAKNRRVEIKIVEVK